MIIPKNQFLIKPVFIHHKLVIIPVSKVVRVEQLPSALINVNVISEQIMDSGTFSPLPQGDYYEIFPAAGKRSLT